MTEKPMHKLISGQNFEPHGGHVVTMQCGCGRTITAQGAKDDALYDLRDTCERFMEDHWRAEEIDGVCRPWI